MNIQQPKRENILGVGVSAINMQQALETIHAWITHRKPHYVCVTPAHSIMACYHDPGLRPIFNRSGLTTPDGMSIVWILRLLGHKHVKRVYGPDLMHALCQTSIMHGYRHYFYGGAPGLVDDLEDRLKTAYPGLSVVGSHTPPFGSVSQEEEEWIKDHIQAAKPDILWVGISSPRQEIWMAEHVEILNVPVLIGVGAAFDFLSGRKKQAPRWIQRSGLEWLYRLASEPKRLWRRYAQYPHFLLLLLAQVMGLKKFPIE
ncbi:MAG: glycosyl transferase [Chloroflexi bacterium RBG_16_48_8]|nr:MAG: glycosyl transferase [Chloroflexi bacterium RBG_16_48_8]